MTFINTFLSLIYQLSNFLIFSLGLFSHIVLVNNISHDIFLLILSIFLINLVLLLSY